MGLLRVSSFDKFDDVLLSALAVKVVSLLSVHAKSNETMHKKVRINENNEAAHYLIVGYPLTSK